VSSARSGFSDLPFSGLWRLSLLPFPFFFPSSLWLLLPARSTPSLSSSRSLTRQRQKTCVLLNRFFFPLGGPSPFSPRPLYRSLPRTPGPASPYGGPGIPPKQCPKPYSPVAIVLASPWSPFYPFYMDISSFDSIRVFVHSPEVPKDGDGGFRTFFFFSLLPPVPPSVSALVSRSPPSPSNTSLKRRLSH